MLLKFYIDDEVHRLTHHDINKNITNQICKCAFRFNEEIWKNEDIYITFMDLHNNGITIHIGEWKEEIYCIVPPSIFKHFCFKMYIYSEGLRTNVVEIKVSNHIIPNIKFCNHNRQNNHTNQKDNHNAILTDDGKMILYW